MARRKKKKGRGKQPKLKRAEDGPFNPLFIDPAFLNKDAQGASKEVQRSEPPPPEKEPDDAHYFLEAMSDVEPIPKKAGTFRPRPNTEVRPPHRAKNNELEAMAHLSDLISGAAELDITFSDEYIEGSVRGFSRKLMRRLKKGRFPVQDYVDLHGLTKQEAEVKVRDFLVKSHRLGKRCVLIVHGRGLNSENHIPVLKERLPLWLRRGPVRKIVLAFSTAMPYDGGTGAVYILLRGRNVSVRSDG